MPGRAPPATEAMIAHLQAADRQAASTQLYGQRSRAQARLLDQLELELEELASSATEDEIAAETGRGASTTQVAPFTRQRPARQPFPEHLPRERVVEPAPTACPCCGGARLRKLGEDITETLEVIPRSGRSSSTCARSSPAAPARRSASRRRRST